MTNTAIILPAHIMTFLQAILSLRVQANTLDIPFVFQSRTYGALDSAFTCALTDALTTTGVGLDNALAIARLLNHETVDNGEDLAYQINLWNRDLISLDTF